MACLAGIAENAPLSVTHLISSLMEGAHLVGKVGTVGSSLIVGSEVIQHRKILRDRVELSFAIN